MISCGNQKSRIGKQNPPARSQHTVNELYVVIIYVIIVVASALYMNDHF
jgi:hypothetical protein